MLKNLDLVVHLTNILASVVKITFNESDCSLFPIYHRIMDLNVCNISHKSLKSLTIYWLLQRNGNVKVHLLFFIVALLSVPSHDCSHFFRVFFPLLWKTGTHLVDRKPCDSVNLCSETVILENLG